LCERLICQPLGELQLTAGNALASIPWGSWDTLPLFHGDTLPSIPWDALPSIPWRYTTLYSM